MHVSMGILGLANVAGLDELLGLRLGVSAGHRQTAVAFPSQTLLYLLLLHATWSAAVVVYNVLAPPIACVAVEIFQPLQPFVLAFFIPVFTMESVRGALVLAGVPRDAILMDALDSSLGILSQVGSTIYDVMTRQPKRRERDNDRRKMIFAAVTAIVGLGFISMIYMNTVSWPLFGKFTVMIFAVYTLLSSLARILEFSIEPRTVWLVAITGYLIVMCIEIAGRSWLQRWVISGLSGLVALLFLEIIGLSEMSVLQVQRARDGQFCPLPPNSGAHAWLVCTTILAGTVMVETADWPWYGNLGATGFVIVAALWYRKTSEDKAKRNPPVTQTKPQEIPTSHGVHNSNSNSNSDGITLDQPYYIDAIIPPAEYNGMIRTPKPQTQGSVGGEKQDTAIRLFRRQLKKSLMNRGLGAMQTKAIRHRLSRSITELDVVRGICDADYLEELIDTATDFEIMNNPDFVY